MEATSQTIPLVSLGVSVATGVYVYTNVKETRDQLELLAVHMKNVLEVNAALVRDVKKLSESLNMANHKIGVLEHVLITSGLIDVTPQLQYKKDPDSDEDSISSLKRQAEELKKKKSKKSKKGKRT